MVPASLMLLALAAEPDFTVMERRWLDGFERASMLRLEREHERCRLEAAEPRRLNRIPRRDPKPIALSHQGERDLQDLLRRVQESR